MSEQSAELYLGESVDPATGNRSGRPIRQPAHALTTHGVVVGMTGSGKTGLGVVLLEEALLAGVPVLVLDPKGDMGNLLLTFPELEPEQFRPWVDLGEGRRQEAEVDALAASTAATWKKGLASWGLGSERIRELRDSARFTIYTPGSSAGVPLNLLGSLEAPSDPKSLDRELMAEGIEGFVSSLLTIAGLDADPLSSPGHILLSNIIEHSWGEGRDLTLPDLIRSVQDPPFRKMGVFALDEFFPEPERRKLAVRLNSLLASPAFSSWLQGSPLDIDRLIRSPDGRPAASIVYLAHLSDAERQFVVTLLLTRLVTWMRRQPGTSELRLLVYMDEMFGFAPPTAAPPSKKPILTIFKQGRAHGVGMVVSTQNPVDLDYKVISNAGTWMLGRLQTERDRDRVLEGLRSASGAVDISAVGDLLSGLRKREFVLRTARSDEPAVFTTRWAMSFLRGSLTREEVARLSEDADPASAEIGDERPAGAPARLDNGQETAAPAEDETAIPPAIPATVPVYHLDPAAPWSATIGAVSGSARLEPALAARVRLLFDDAHAGVQHSEEWEAVFFPLGARFDPSSGITVDYDARDFRERPAEGVRYVLTDAPIATAAFYRDAARQIAEEAYRQRRISILRNPSLKLYSRVGEDRDAFLQRCRSVAREGADGEVSSLRERFEQRIDRVRDTVLQAESRVRELEVDVSTRKQQELVAGAGKLISMFLRGRATATGLSGMASRRSVTRRTEERLRTAEDRQLQREREIEDLEEELAEKVESIVADWEAKAEQVETLEVGLEKNDIVVDELALLWVPAADPYGTPSGRR